MTSKRPTYQHANQHAKNPHQRNTRQTPNARRGGAAGRGAGTSASRRGSGTSASRRGAGVHSAGASASRRSAGASANRRGAGASMGAIRRSSGVHSTGANHVDAARTENRAGVSRRGTNTKDNANTLITRRRFLFGAAGVGVLAAAAGGGVYLASTMQNDDAPELSTLSVAEDQVSSLDALTEVDASSAMSLIGNFSLPYGTLVWSNDDSVAACLLPTEQAKPLTQIGLLFLGSGECPTVVSEAVGQAEGFEIYDVRACASGIIWTEADILDGIWRVYAASFDGNALGEALLLDSGDSDWEMPTLAAVDGYAFWQVLPQSTGNASREKSLLKRAAFGSDDAEVIYSSTGRMSTPIYALADAVVITPRTDTSTVHHQLTYIDARTGNVIDAMVLPASMKPLEAGYGETGFTFCFDGIYSYGDGIANLGTYTPRTSVATTQAADGIGNAAYSDTPWFRFPRNPTAAPAWCGQWLMVKSTSAVCGINLEENTYFAFDVKSGAASYGDYLASSGSSSVVVTYSNIDYQPLDGEEKQYCNVRVWACV